MEGEIAFAQDLLNQGLNLQRTPTGLAPRAAPPGFSWHHADEPGVMQLVPRSQHDRGSIFQKKLHPNGRGGFSLWEKNEVAGYRWAVVGI
ncbi:HNH endonuclease [Mesorhizobium sp. M0152]|uniref:HNH endonuclease n=1 Tax=Mesorhizobium sp. M0152 TaxID=2956898 RepID=UPI00333C6167